MAKPEATGPYSKASWPVIVQQFEKASSEMALPFDIAAYLRALVEDGHLADVGDTVTYEPDEGTVDVHGRIAALLDLGLGIDPQATGYDNIRLRGRIAGLTSRDVEARMDEIAEFSGLGPFLAMPVKTYSAGMQARLAFAAATAVEADVLLMDEWIAVGDADFQTLAHKRLLKLVERAGILVLGSHDLGLIRLYCNKVMRLEGGVASPVTDILKLDELLAA